MSQEKYYSRILESIWPRDTKRGDTRNKIHKWWRDQLTDSERVFYSILTINLLVFIGWRIPTLAGQMNKYFTLRPLVGVPLCLPMVLSTFSHYSLFHLGVNMYAFHSFSRAIGDAMDSGQFTALYLTSGVTASLASLSYKVAVGSTVASLGASGAILGVVSFVCTAMPNSQLLLFFIPMSAAHAIKAIMAFDTVGLFMKWSILDHAAHLGGTLYGQLFFNDGRIIYTKWSQSVINLWKQLKVKYKPEK